MGHQDNIKRRIGVYPGTFDPITNGHMDLIRRSLRLVDELIIAVSVSESKKPLFSMDERVEMVKQSIVGLPGWKRIRVASFTGLLVDFAREQKANVILRGLRAVSDFEYEFQMSCMNSRLASDIETVFLPASEKPHFLASRFIKEIARLEGDVTDMVSAFVKEQLDCKFG